MEGVIKMTHLTKNTGWSWCNHCLHEGPEFELLVGSDTHTDGLPVEENYPEAPWSHCPKCGHYSALV